MQNKDDKKRTAVRAFRKQLRWSQEELAVKAGVSAKTVDNAEQRHKINEDSAEYITETIAKHLKVIVESESVRDQLEEMKLNPEKLPKLDVQDLFLKKGNKVFIARPVPDGHSSRKEAVVETLRRAAERAKKKV